MTDQSRELAGRGAIITGANRGLGRVIAEHFVRAGASVLLTARDGDLLAQVHREVTALAQGDQKVLSREGDVSKREDCDAWVAEASRELPNFCILVNNAGVHGAKGALEDADWGQWVRTIEINLLGPVYLCRAVIPVFKKNWYGKIINLSGGGATSPMPQVSAYAASKAALVRTTETLAVELRDWNIDVNAIAPGAMNTRMLEEVLEAGPLKVGKELYERSLKQKAEGGAPPQKAASLAVFLASPQTNGITGRLISAVWDDWRKLPAQREQLSKSDVFTLRRIVPKDRGMG
jgi:NAD(P)-dependent dehydrogenase (short-subunit alcohol dehydrogenase family)